VVLLISGAVVVLNLLLASGVIRNITVVTPFFIFYVLYSFESIYKKIKHFKYFD